MAFTGSRRFIGLGFGAIQSGLFVYEAFRTGDYAPPLVIDVRADLVAGLRADSGHFRVNIARADRIDVATIGPVNAVDSTVPEERELTVEAIARADEAAAEAVLEVVAEGRARLEAWMADGLEGIAQRGIA